MASRPKTLVASVLPVWIGFAIAWDHPACYGWWVIPILAAALLIQIGTNVANDYFDFHKGADVERKGPTRVTQAGLLSPDTVRNGFIVIFALAIAIGFPLAFRGGWSIVAIGLISIVCGVFYTAGPFAFAYNGLSELFVIVFFGIVAVAGTYYLLTLEWLGMTAYAGIAPGLLATALLCINNMRDIPTDRKSAKNTLPARFGYGFARIEYLLCVLGAFITGLLIIIKLQTPLHALWLLPVLLYAFYPVRLIYSTTDPLQLNVALAMTAKLQILFGILFGIAIIL